MIEPHLRPSRSYFRTFLRVLLLILLPLTLVLPVAILRWMGLDKKRGELVLFYYKCCCFICGLKITVEGELTKERPLMLLSNHSSYLDIFILGALTPLSFTPKKEIRSWPFIGYLCLLSDCVFIERKPKDIQRARAEIVEKLSAQKTVVLFPEGTTGDGFTVKPFKSGFLSLFETYDLPIQPVTLAYTGIGKVPISGGTREMVSWVGDATLLGHLVHLFSFPYVAVTVKIHEVQRMKDHGDRKALAKACEVMVTESLKTILEEHGVTS